MTRIREQPVDWADLYSTASANLWEQKPHEFSVLAAEIAPAGDALDLGCGEGYDALFLAEHGFSVTAVDISDVALSGLDRMAHEKGADIRTQKVDVRSIELSRQRAIIASYGVLHFLGVDYEERIKHFQDMTVDSGVHALYVFGGEGDFCDIAQHKYWFPSVDEVRRLYRNWTIHRLQEKTIPMLIRGDQGEVLHNSMIKLMAQKEENSSRKPDLH